MLMTVFGRKLAAELVIPDMVEAAVKKTNKPRSRSSDEDTIKGNLH